MNLIKDVNWKKKISVSNLKDFDQTSENNLIRYHVKISVKHVLVSS